MTIPEPPYLYDAPSQRPTSVPYSSFEPKRATQKSWDAATTVSRPRSTQSGPLLDFNRHPDSYMIVTGNELSHKPMARNTKLWVSSMRWIQFSLRLLQLVGAMGELFCVICLQPSVQTQAWIMRITPGYDILITLYAVYHLIRSSKARTPASSASYHFFAFMMDAGLIPFYAFISVFTINNWELRDSSTTSSEVWTSFFTTSKITIDIIFSAFCIACAMAGMHFISLCLDLYLVVVFRKIANLPPDMNPLEDNLTSRKSSKHKYKNSELSLASTVDEKKAGFYGGSTLSASTVNFDGPRSSMLDKKEPELRQVAFSHSRTGSDMSFSPHNPNSARLSKQQYDHAVYQQASARNSTVSLGSYITANSRSASPDKTRAARKEMLSDNWYVLDEEPADVSTQRMPAVTEEPRFVHEPLGMNPPTPSPDKQQHSRDVLGEVCINRSQTVTSDTTNTSSVYSESAPSLKSNKARTPKSRYYGDLAAAARGVRGYAQVPQSENSPSAHRDHDVYNSQSPGKKIRVISRSGADIADETMKSIPEKSSRRRMVSGKDAEEGVAGFWY